MSVWAFSLFVLVFCGGAAYWLMRVCLAHVQHVCWGCGRDPDGCACPGDDNVFVFTPWDDLDDDEREEDGPDPSR